MQDNRYPIGKFSAKKDIAEAERAALITAIAEAPGNLAKAVAGLSASQLDTPYRDGGWSVRQVVHHLPDSHLNAYVRLKLALTEHQPTIKPYDERLWAETAEARTGPIDVSLALLDGLHQRWVLLLRSLRPADFTRTFNHPENGVRNVDWLVQLYAWHGRHHIAQITALRDRMGW